MMSFASFFPENKPEHLGANLYEVPLTPAEMGNTVPVPMTGKDSAHSVPSAAVACSQALPGNDGIFGDALVIDEGDLDTDTETPEAGKTQEPEAEKTKEAEAEKTKEALAEGTQEATAEKTQEAVAEGTQKAEAQGTLDPKAEETKEAWGEETKIPEVVETQDSEEKETQRPEVEEKEKLYNEKIQQTLPALTKDADFREREIILNCLENAMGCVPDMQRCIIEARSRWVVEHFLSKCGDTATCTLWTRIRTLIDELRELLFNCNDVTGGKYDNMLASIFCKASKDANPPKKHEHWAYLQPGADPEPTLLSLTEDMETIITYMHQFLFDIPVEG